MARAAGIPSLFMINKKGEPRPMVDLTGKFFLLDELDEKFVKECVDVEQYQEYQHAPGVRRPLWHHGGGDA